MATSLRWSVAGQSDPGRVREQNEDRWFADADRGLFIVADGMGGHAAGALAAEKLDRVFRSASQVEKATGVAVLGMVPLVKGAVGQRSSIVTQVLDKTTSSAAEAMRAGTRPAAMEVADLDGDATVHGSHVAEALSFRASFDGGGDLAAGCLASRPCGRIRIRERSNKCRGVRMCGPIDHGRRRS